MEKKISPNLAGKRIFVCSTGGIPHRSRGASTVLFFSYLEQLKLNNFPILHWLISDSKKDCEDNLEAYKQELVQPGKFELIVSQTTFLERIKGCFREVTFAPLFNEVADRVKLFNPDIILCLDLASAGFLEEYLKHNIKVKVIWLGDLRYRVAWYHALYSIKEDWKNIIHFPANCLACLSWRFLYKKILANFQLIVVSSKSSEAEMRKLGLPSIYLPYPWPVEVATENLSLPVRPALPSFLFLGTLVALGSRSAFHFILAKIYPRLIKLWGAGCFQIFLCGSAGLPKWVENELPKYPEIKYLGFVEDLNSLMLSCHAVIAPIDVPVGNRSRIITAMALGSLVVAHANTALGNPDLVDGETCYLAANGVEFAAKMKLAYERPDLSEQIISRAREAYQSHFEPTVASDLLIQEIARLVNLRL